MRLRPPLFLLAALLVATAPPAEAKKKKPPPPEETEETQAVESPPPEAPSPPPEAESPPPAEPAPEPPPAAAPQPAAAGDWRDPTEPNGVRQLYLGLRYRGTIVPKFLMNLFVDEGATVYTNTFGVELDIRRDHYSVIPHLTYAEYGMDDTLFLQKNKDATLAANWSYVNSSLKAIYAGIDILWSTRVHRMIDFEYGLGIDVGVVWGDLIDNWVYMNPNGPYQSSSGTRFSPCRSEADGIGCSRGDHSNADTAKVGGYVEPSWFSGGPRPSFYARLSLPILGLRIHPIRDFETRVQFGFSLTEGFFFSFSGNYRLPGGP
jgi:hypothetical protein